MAIQRKFIPTILLVAISLTVASACAASGQPDAPVPKPTQEQVSKAECEAFKNWFEKSASNIAELQKLAPQVEAINYIQPNLSWMKDLSTRLDSLATAQDEIAYPYDEYIGTAQFELYQALFLYGSGISHWV